MLFVDGRRDEPAAAARRVFEAVAWPSLCERSVLDVAVDPRLAQWFGIRRVPAVAIVCDGTLIAIEHDCDRVACERLLGAADRRDMRAWRGLL